MRKKLIALVALSASMLLAATASAAQATEGETDSGQERPYVSSHVTLTDLSTGQVLYSSTERVEISETGPTTVTSPTVPDHATVRPLSSIGGTKNPGSVKSSLTLTYTRKADLIRLEKASGSWTPAHSIELRNRYVKIIGGGALPHTITKYPTSNSYSYTTGWDYGIFNSSANYVPRTVAEVDYRIAGTNGQLVRMTHWVDLSGA
ncbi:hypothetical protein WDU99_10340 [Microbacterium sp. Mu-80]|uniref:Uncharacterized protein n=1 Tax=Microbacterium bandirmense TaxID=3122050 RepID=A0ABU8LBJ0_9MICO